MKITYLGRKEYNPVLTVYSNTELVIWSIYKNGELLNDFSDLAGGGRGRGLPPPERALNSKLLTMDKQGDNSSKIIGYS